MYTLTPTIHTYTHTYIQTYTHAITPTIHMYTHTYIQTYTHAPTNPHTHHTYKYSHNISLPKFYLNSFQTARAWEGCTMQVLVFKMSSLESAVKNRGSIQLKGLVGNVHQKYVQCYSNNIQWLMCNVLTLSDNIIWCYNLAHLYLSRKHLSPQLFLFWGEEGYCRLWSLHHETLGYRVTHACINWISYNCLWAILVIL